MGMMEQLMIPQVNVPNAAVVKVNLPEMRDMHTTVSIVDVFRAESSAVLHSLLQPTTIVTGVVKVAERTLVGRTLTTVLELHIVKEYANIHV